MFSIYLQLFTKGNVDKILEVMFDGDPRLQVQYLMIIDTLAKKNIQIVLHTVDTLLNNDFNEHCYHYLYSILRKLASRSSEVILSSQLRFLLLS